MHQEINKSRHQQGLCMRISASRKPNAHAFIISLKLMDIISLYYFAKAQA